VDGAFDSCLKDTGLNPAKADHNVTTVGKLFTPSVSSEAEGWLNQLAPVIATQGKSFTCIGSALLSLSFLIGE